MPPEWRIRDQKRFPPDDPREWLNRARSNLAQAEKGAEVAGGYSEEAMATAQATVRWAVGAIGVEGSRGG